MHAKVIIMSTMLSGAANAWHIVVFKATFNIIKSQKRLSAFRILDYIKKIFFSKFPTVCGELPSKFLAHDSKWSDESCVKFS